jgi:hypothetical protein
MHSPKAGGAWKTGESVNGIGGRSENSESINTSESGNNGRNRQLAQ